MRFVVGGAGHRSHRTGDPSLMPGLRGRLRRPSVARSARSKSKTGRIATTLIARAAASIRTGRDAPDRCRRGVPGMTMCGRRRRVGRLTSHIVRPGTSRWALVFPRACGAVTAPASATEAVRDPQSANRDDQGLVGVPFSTVKTATARAAAPDASLLPRPPAPYV